jgi:uncharacterized protein DUF4279
MSRASRLATSTTKTEAQADRKAFVTLRFAGDELDPRDISAILPVEPTRAHRKGEEFFAGANAGKLRGRTGLWFLATDKLVDSDDLRDHLEFVHTLLYPKSGDKRRITKLHDALERARSHARITCFWHGEPGEPVPQIPAQFKSAVKPLAADIESDFASGKTSTKERQAITKSNISSYSTLHRYFLNASRNRSLFIAKLQNGAVDHPHTMVHLDLWYGCLFVVVEGWRKKKIRDEAVTAFLRDRAKVALLEGYRNAVFHYGSNYIDPRQEKLFKDEAFVDWVSGLHDAISNFFLREITGDVLQ